ncbi:aryl-alcohol dehydrogenase [Lentinula lateritia]|nr:aryl-alcohol dehydrogenase [Lentinula lateritia]
MSISTTQPKKMTYVRLGNSGLKVAKIILGCITYGSSTWSTWALSEEEGIKHIKAAYIYSNGLSEVILGNAIKKLKLPQEEIVVMTKFAGVIDHTPDYEGGVYADFTHADQDGYHIFATVKASLECLQLDYIDVLQSLHDVVQAGYVCYIGMSSCRAWQYYSITNKLTPFISMQNHYNMVYREEEREMVPSLKSPLARGMLTHLLSGRTPRSGTDSMVKGYEHDSSHQIIERVEEIAKKKGVTMAQVALAWLWTREIGTTSVKNLFDLIDALDLLDLKLSEEEVKYLDEPYQAHPIFSFY